MKKKPIEQRIIDGLLRLPNEMFVKYDFYGDFYNIEFGEKDKVWYDIYIRSKNIVIYKFNGTMEEWDKSIDFDFTKKFKF